jgi:hypothetical protein
MNRADNRSHYLKARLTAEEHALLRTRSAKMGLTVSQFIRAALAAYQQKPHHALALPLPPSAPVTPPPMVIAPATAPLYAYQQTRKPS